MHLMQQEVAVLRKMDRFLGVVGATLHRELPTVRGGTASHRCSFVPSSDGWQHCMGTQSRLGRLSSKSSSQEIVRSRAGIEPAKALSIVVLPAWVHQQTVPQTLD